MAKAIKRAYSTSGGGVDMESIQELYFGSIEEREALADAITNKGVDTNVADSLETMASNIGLIKSEKVYIEETKTDTVTLPEYTQSLTYRTITFSKNIFAIKEIKFAESQRAGGIGSIAVSGNKFTYGVRHPVGGSNNGITMTVTALLEP